MLTHSAHNRISLATAAEVAARLLGTRREGDHYRTHGYCHGSGDKPTSASLVFSDPPRPGEQSLHVHCYKCSPRTPAERDAIRHALQKATGLQLCSCRACWEARRTGRPPSGATTRPAAPRRFTPATTQPAPQCPQNAVIVSQWGAHQLPHDDAGGRSHASPCPAMPAARRADRVDTGRSPVPLCRPFPAVPVHRQLRPAAQARRCPNLRQGPAVAPRRRLYPRRRTRPAAHTYRLDSR